MRHTRLAITATACLGATAASASAQLITAYTGDEGGDRSWFINVETGDDFGGVLGGFNALATDPTTDRVFGSSGRNLVVYDVIDGEPEQDGSPRLVVDENGDTVISIRSFAFGNGELYAYHTGLGDAPGGIYRIDVDTRIETDRSPQVPATLVTPLQDLPLPQPIDFVAEGNVAGLTYDTDRNEFLIGVKTYEEQDGLDEGEPGPADEFENFIGNDIFAFDPETGQSSPVVEIPFTLEEGGFDGMAYGRDRIYLDCGAPCGDISIYNRVTGVFEQQIGAPRRFGNGAGGAAFLETVAFPDADIQPCNGDTNNSDTIDSTDLLTVLANFGQTTDNGRSSGDVAPPSQPDGNVGSADLLLVLSNFGTACS